MHVRSPRQLICSGSDRCRFSVNAIGQRSQLSPPHIGDPAKHDDVASVMALEHFGDVFAGDVIDVDAHERAATRLERRERLLSS